MKKTKCCKTQVRNEDRQKQQSLQSARPDTLDPMIELRVSGDLSFVVRKLRPSEALNLARFLLAKVVKCQGISTFTPTEHSLLHASVEKIHSYAKNRQWAYWHNDLLTGIASASWVFRQYCLGEEVPTFRLERLKNSNWFPSDHSYFGWWISQQLSTWLISINRLLRKSPRPRRFIGVGYRDHGTRRDAAFDGSPSWQDVAVLGDFKKLNPLLHDPNGLMYSGLGAAFGMN